MSPRYKYIDDFRSLEEQHPRLSFLFPNSRHVTLSMGALNAAIDGVSTASAFIDSSMDQPDILASSTLCLVLGDGQHPRTGILSAIQCGWNVVSIDSELDDKWVQGESLLPDGCNFMGFRGDMTRFLSEGMERVQSSLCCVSDIQQLVIICVERDGSFDQLKSLRGHLGISDLRMLYNSAPVNVISVSSDEVAGDCPLNIPPISSFVDEEILSKIRRVRVWNFQGSRRNRKLNKENKKATNAFISTSNKRQTNSKVSQLQKQQDLAAQRRLELNTKSCDEPRNDSSSINIERSNVSSKSFDTPCRNKTIGLRAQSSLVPLIHVVPPSCMPRSASERQARIYEVGSIDNHQDTLRTMKREFSPSNLSFNTASTADSSIHEFDCNDSGPQMTIIYNTGDFVEVRVGNIYQAGTIANQLFRGVYNVTLFGDTPAWKSKRLQVDIYQQSPECIPEVLARDIRPYTPAPLGETIYVFVNGRERKCRVHGYSYDDCDALTARHMKYIVKFASKNGGWRNEKHRVPVYRAYKLLDEVVLCKNANQNRCENNGLM